MPGVRVTVVAKRLLGASLTAAIFMLTVDAGEDEAEPSDAVTVKVLIPFSLVAGT